MSNQPGPHSSHDAVFRRFLAKPENAASALRALLPSGVADRLELAKLTQIPGSFVDPELRQRHTDLLFSAPCDGRDAFVYLLMEHQSSCDPLMPWRMLNYTTRIWERYLKQHTSATQLPAVIPLVVHHNQRAWSGPVDLIDLIDLDPDVLDACGDFLPRQRFLLDDLANVDTLTLRARPLTPETGLVMWLLKVATGTLVWLTIYARGRQRWPRCWLGPTVWRTS